MPIDLKFRLLRTTLRKNSKKIIEKVVTDYVQRENGKAKNLLGANICMFCGSSQELTREHVIPRWLFDGCPRKNFITNINGLSQTYNRTTIPACSSCNNDLLNSIEKYINTMLTTVDLEKTFFTVSEQQNIIRWLGVIEYKFQLLDIKRKFLKSKVKGFIPYLTDLPISMLRLNKDYTPSKVVSEIRRSLMRITIRNKDEHLNSLIIFKSSNKGFYFFHTMDDFIFLELPQHAMAFFYFFNRKFRTAKEGHKEAIKIIDQVCKR